MVYKLGVKVNEISFIVTLQYIYITEICCELSVCKLFYVVTRLNMIAINDDK